jgi:hypothetical protein
MHAGRNGNMTVWLSRAPTSLFLLDYGRKTRVSADGARLGWVGGYRFDDDEEEQYSSCARALRRGDSDHRWGLGPSLGSIRGRIDETSGVRQQGVPPGKLGHMQTKELDLISSTPIRNPSLTGHTTYIGDHLGQRQNTRSKKNTIYLCGPSNGKIHLQVSASEVRVVKNKSPRILRSNRARRLVFRLIKPAVGY